MKNLFFNFFFVISLLLFFFAQGCKNDNGILLIESKIICVSPIVKSTGMTLPESIGQLFAPYSSCDDKFIRLSPVLLAYGKIENEYRPELLGQSFAGNMKNKRLIDRMIKRGLKKTEVPAILTESGFDSTNYSLKLKNELKGHLKKAYFVFFSTKPGDVEDYEGFRIHYYPDSVIAEINRFYCENKEKPLPIRIIVNPTLDSKKSEEVAGPYSTSSQLYGGFEYAVFRVPFSQELSKRVHLVRNPFPKNVNDFLNYLSSPSSNVSGSGIFEDPSHFFAITGAMFEEKDGMPPGLVIDNGRVLKNINLNPGKGNFYEPGPNGVFFISSNSVDIVETRYLQNYNGIDFAIQSGPLLVFNNAVNPKFKPSSNNQFARSAVGIRTNGDQKELVFVTSLGPVSFYDIATFMKYNENCESAMHLESINAFMTYPGFIYPINNQVIMNLLVIR
jgi:hypothetical protein